MLKKIAYRIVFKDLTSRGGLLTGRYSGKPDDSEFMYGIATAMDMIGMMAGDMEAEEKFSYEFLVNMKESERAYRENGQKQ